MMKYINAKDILPAALIKELQQYLDGGYIYIPSLKVKRWGTCSGYLEELRVRNQKILAEHKNGRSISEIADAYALAESTVRKIIQRSR